MSLLLHSTRRARLGVVDSNNLTLSLINATNTTAADLSESSSMDPLVTVGCILILMAAFTLACAMNIQQFALSGDLNSPVFKRVRCCSGGDDKWNSARNVLWVFGLGVYLLAQLLVVGSLALAPFALVSALFGMVLVFDSLIGYVVFKKQFSRLELAGMFVIVGSLAVCAPNSPNVEYDVSAAFMEDRFKQPSAIVVLSILACLAVSGWLMVRAFEKKYGVTKDTKDSNDSNDSNDSDTDSERETVFVPDKVFRRMQIVYPAILAIIETMGSASLKAIAGMVQTTGSEKTAMFWVVVVMWLFAIMNTVLWLRFVYQQFRTSECLPTEIGLTTVFSIYVGLWVYQEQQYASTMMLSIMIVCTFMICVGIGMIVVGGGNRLGKEAEAEASKKEVEETIDLEKAIVDVDQILSPPMTHTRTSNSSLQTSPSGRFPFIPPSPVRRRPASEKKIKPKRGSLVVWAGQVVERVRRGSRRSSSSGMPKLQPQDGLGVNNMNVTPVKKVRKSDLLVASPVNSKDVERRLAATPVLRQVEVQIVDSTNTSAENSPTNSTTSKSNGESSSPLNSVIQRIIHWA